MVDVELDIVAAERRRDVCIDIVHGEARSAMNVSERWGDYSPWMNVRRAGVGRLRRAELS